MDGRAASLGIDSRGPTHLRHLGRRNELAICTVDHVEVTVLIRLSDDLTRASVYGDICQQQMLNCVIVPFVTGCALVVPFQLASVCVDSHDGSNVEIVEMPCVAAVTHIGRPGCSIARPEI